MALESQPLDISCAHLSLIRYQLETRGQVTIGNNRPQIPARMAILKEIAGDKVVFVDEKANVAQEIPEVSDPIHQERIALARLAGQRSHCWWVKVGCGVYDAKGNLFAESNNDPLIEESRCTELEISPQEAMKMLDKEKEERLLFCSGVHDVENMVTKVAVGPGGLGNKIWYLSLEPCDRCAGVLTRVQPIAVYFSAGVGRRKYYNSLGLEFLQLAKIPTFFVRMPGE